MSLNRRLPILNTIVEDQSVSSFVRQFAALLRHRPPLADAEARMVCCIGDALALRCRLEFEDLAVIAHDVAYDPGVRISEMDSQDLISDVHRRLFGRDSR